MIFTFYSYKGGVGRSMALANIAELFCQNGIDVLMVDWDLEAPGLERFFFPELDTVQHEQIVAKPGLIDMLLAYKETMSQNNLIKADMTALEVLRLIPHPKDYAIPLPLTDHTGKLALITAGKRSNNTFESYAEHVINFDWHDFYRNWKGGAYIEWLRQEFLNLAGDDGIVLIDSRTGVTEIGGVCTYQLADTVVMLSAPNEQNFEGTQQMVERFLDEQVQENRGKRPLNLIVVPARVDRSEKILTDDFKKEIEELYKTSSLSRREQSKPISVWEFGIPYIPFYSFKEKIAMRERSTGGAADMVRAFEQLAKAMAIVSGSPVLKNKFANLPLSADDGSGTYLVQIEQDLRNEDFDGAQNQLDDFQRKLPQHFQVREMQKRIAQAKQEKTDRLGKNIQETLAENIGQSYAYFEDQISLWIDEYQKIAPSDDRNIDKWRITLRELTRTREIERATREVQIRCTDLWHEGGVRNASEALNLVLDLEKRYGPHPEIIELKEQAQDKYQRERSFASASITSAIVGAFESLIAEYEKLRTQGIEFVPRIRYVRDEQGRLIIQDGNLSLEDNGVEESRDISEAIFELKRAARDYATQKAEEKLARAREILDVSPHQAREIVSDALNLYLLPPEPKLELEQFQQNRVSPAIKRRQDAEQIRDEAEVLEVLEGWRQLQQALGVDQNVPGIEEVRSRLRPRFRQRVEQELEGFRKTVLNVAQDDQATDQYRKSLQLVINQATEFANLSNQDATLADLTNRLTTFVNQTKNNLEEWDYVTVQVRALRGYVIEGEFGKASRLLDEIRTRLGKERFLTFAELQIIERQVEARLNVDKLIAQISGKSYESKEEISKDIKRLEGELEKYPDHPNPEPLKALLNRLRSRYNFVSGRDLFLEGENYLEARPLLRGVFGEDRDEARELLVRLEEAESQQAQQDKDLGEATRAGESGEWERAYNLLAHWDDKPLAAGLRTEFRREQKTVREGWARLVQKTLDSLRESKSLDVAEIRKNLQILVKLGTADVAVREKDTLAPCLARIARQQQNQGEWEKSISAWQEVLQYDFDEVYRQEAQEAEKKWAELQASLTPVDYVKAEQIYQKLKTRYHDDPAINLALADIYLRQNKLDDAEREIRQARENLQTDGIGKQITDIEEVLNQKKELYKKQTQIQRSLTAEKGIKDYRAALNQYNDELTSASQEVAIALSQWWEEQIKQLVEVLGIQLEQRLRDKQPVWQVIPVLSKILVLQPAHGQANTLLVQISSNVSSLNHQTERILSGVMDRNERDGLVMLDSLVKRVDEGRREVDAYVEFLQDHPDKMPEARSKAKELGEQAKKLSQYHQHLNTMQNIMQQGYAQLGRAKITNQWTPVEQIKTRLQQGEDGEHPAVILFARQVDRVKRTRQELESKIQDLLARLQADQFVQAMRLSKDIRSLDPDNEYSLHGSLELRTSLRSYSVPFLNLETLLADHLIDIRQLYDWFYPVLRLAPWCPPRLPVIEPVGHDLSHLTQLIRKWLDGNNQNEEGSFWEQIRRYVLSAVRNLKAEGKFAEAIALCRDISGEDGNLQMKTSPFAGRYTLKEIHTRLNQVPLLHDPDVISEPINEAMQLAQICGELINNWIGQVAQEQGTIQQEEEVFRRLHQELTNILNRYGSWWFFWQKRKMRNRGLVIWHELEKISPRYQRLNQFRYILLET